VYLQHRPVGNALISLRSISAATTQIIVNSPTLEHPFLSADGQFVTYGQLENSTLKVFSKDLTTGQQLTLTNPTSPVNHLGMMWQMPFAGETKPALDPSVESFEGFGSTVAVTGNVMVVGSLFDSYDADGDGTLEANAGSAYIYLRSAQGSWNLLKQLKPSDARAFGQFGTSVAISGNTLVIGAGGANATYIFQKDQGGINTWGEVKKLVASDGTQRDVFGNAVAISGNTVVVGAPFEAHDVDGNGTDDLLVGAAYIFFKDKGGTNNWGEVKKLVASDAQVNPGRVGELFGNSVAISGTTVVVGAVFDIRDTDGNGTEEFDVGAAYIFQKDQGGVNTWGEVKKLLASDGGQADRFGQSLAIAGTTVVVGAHDETHDADGIAGDELFVGAAYIFEKDQGGPNAWGEVKKLVASDDTKGDEFGTAVAMSGDVIAVGASKKLIGQINPGAVYLFGRNQGGANTWGEVGKLLASDGEDFDRFGQAVAISGTTVVVGAPQDDDNGEDSGSVYVLE
jgi:FG-GAP repeat